MEEAGCPAENKTVYFRKTSGPQILRGQMAGLFGTFGAQNTMKKPYNYNSLFSPWKAYYGGWWHVETRGRVFENAKPRTRQHAHLKRLHVNPKMPECRSLPLALPTAPKR